MKKFTLIELLVVVAIIGILVSILMPSLTKARATAKAGVCASNLKQIGVGIQMYEIDNSRTPPPILIVEGHTFFNGMTHVTWSAQIAHDYLDSSNDSLNAMAPFICPQNDYQERTQTYGWGRFYESYGGNGWNEVRFEVGTPVLTPTRALGVISAGVESPSDLYLVADAVYYRFSNSDGGTHPDCGSGEGGGYPCKIKYDAGDKNHGSLKYDHLDKLNMLHMDKHVSRTKRVVTKSNSSAHWFANP